MWQAVHCDLCNMRGLLSLHKRTLRDKSTKGRGHLLIIQSTASIASGFQACTEEKLVKGISEWTEGHRMRRHSADPFQFRAQSCPSGDLLQCPSAIKETAMPVLSQLARVWQGSCGSSAQTGREWEFKDTSSWHIFDYLDGLAFTWSETL